MSLIIQYQNGGQGESQDFKDFDVNPTSDNIIFA